MAEKEYIERNAAIEQIRVIYCGNCNSYNGVRCRACEFDDAMSLVEDAPAADVVEVVHAHWIDRDGKTWCSNCDASNKQYKPPYCPHCGAKMDGERKKQE